MKKLLIATSNKAKLEEIKYGLKKMENYNIQLLTLNDVRIEKKPQETGITFCENAKIKAKFYGDLTNLPTIADDGGLIVPYLDNEPGVKSRRWLGYEATDKELISYTLKKLQNVARKNRIAYLQTCVCFYLPKLKNLNILSLPRSYKKQNNDLFICQQEKIKGYIAEKPSEKATYGYPFRALFVVEKFSKYYDELTENEHQEINHRLKAIKKLIPKIKLIFDKINIK